MTICKMKDCSNKVTQIEAEMCNACMENYIIQAKKHWEEGTNGFVTTKEMTKNWKAGDVNKANVKKWSYKKEQIIQTDEKGCKFWTTFKQKKYIQGKEV